MGEIVAGVALAAGAGAGAAAAAGALTNIGLAVGLSYLSSALSGSSSSAASKGLQTSVQVGGDQARGCLYGTAAAAGYFPYWNTFGADRLVLQQVFVVGDGPHDGLASVWIYGTRYDVTIAEQDDYRTVYDVEGWTHSGITYLRLVFWHGYEDQPASPTLVSGANPATRWTTADRFAGVAYVQVQAIYHETLFEGGIPDFLFEVRGRRCYDWRLDSTNGGSGAHRWGDEKTWSFTENPFVQLHDYQRGVWRGGERTLGMGIGPVDLDIDAYTAAANACDEEVDESDGSTAPRYTCGTYVSDDEEHASVIQRFLDASGGALYERVGVYSPHAGVGQVTTYPTITDGDLVAGYEVRLAAKRSRSELVNGIFGSYSDPDEQYELIAYTARTDSAAEAADGEIRRTQVDFAPVHKPLQAQRLAKLQLDLARLQGTATITLGLSAVVLEPGDWIRWDSARYGDHRWLITGITQNKDQTSTLSLREISGTAFGWTEDDELDVGFGGETAGAATLLTTVPGMGVAATLITGDDGTRIPAIRVTWTPILDGTVDTIVLQCRVASDATSVIPASTGEVTDGSYLISGLQGATAYEVRGTIRGTPKRTMTWTGWVPVTTGDASVVPDGSISLDQWTDDLRNLVETEMAGAISQLQADQAQVDTALAGLQTADEALAEAQAELDAAMASLDTAVAAAQAAADQAAADVDAAVTTLTNAQASAVAALNAAIGDQAAAIVETQGAVETLEGSVTTQLAGMQSQMDGAQSAIVSVATTAAGPLTDEIARLGTLIAEAAAGASADLDGAKKAIAIRFESMSVSLGQALASISTLQTTVATLDMASATEVEEIRASLDDVSASIVTINSALATLDAATTESISQLSAQISDPTTGLNARALQTTVTTLTATVAGKASASALSDLSAVVNDSSTGLTSKASQTALTTLAATVDGKASAAALTTLSAQVNNATTGLAARALQSDLTTLTATVNGKASASALSTLSAQVNNGTTGLATKASQTDLTNLSATVDGKANASTVSALSTTVSGHTSSITDLDRSISDLGSSTAQSVSKLQALSLFSAAKTWNFAATVEGWAAGNSAITVTWQNAGSGVLRAVASATGGTIVSPTISISGSTNPIVRVRVKVSAGSGTWAGRLLYSTASHGYTLSYYKAISAPADLSDFVVLEFDMGSLTAGGTDWTTSTITGLRLDLWTAATTVMQIDWISVGRVGVATDDETTAAMSASITSQSTAITDLQNNKATAASVTNLAATVDDVASSVNVTAVAASSISGALSAWQIAVTVNSGGTKVSGGILIGVFGSAGSYYSRLYLQADKTYVMNGSATKALMTITDGVAYLNIDMVANGSIKAQQIGAHTITADEITIGGVTTSSLAENAVTNVASSSVSSTFIAADASATVVTTTAISRTSGSVANIHLDFGFYYTTRAPSATGTLPVFTFQLRRTNGGSTTVLRTLYVRDGLYGDTMTFVQSYSGSSYTAKAFSFDYMDTTSLSGATTYDVRCTNSYGVILFTVNLNVTEWKR